MALLATLSSALSYGRRAPLPPTGYGTSIRSGVPEAGVRSAGRAPAAYVPPSRGRRASPRDCRHHPSKWGWLLNPGRAHCAPGSGDPARSAARRTCTTALWWGPRCGSSRCNGRPCPVGRVFAQSTASDTRLCCVCVPKAQPYAPDVSTRRRGVINGRTVRGSSPRSPRATRSAFSRSGGPSVPAGACFAPKLAMRLRCPRSPRGNGS
jgi:hypothetical protein